jgi:small subunit ribosomal protein S2
MAEEKSEFNLNVDEMARAGLHLGHKTSKFHPKMGPYITGIRNTIHILDLEKTKEKFEEALRFIQKLISENKILLVVGTKIQIKDLVKEFANECGLPFINERWLGGTFTNFEVIKKRVEYFKELEKKRADGQFDKYTKKERADIDKELKELEIKFGGLKNLERLPDAIFVLDMKKDELAVREARNKGIKIIAISDTNTDPTLADYFIPASDDARSGVKYILEKIKEAIINQKSKIKNQKSKK